MHSPIWCGIFSGDDIAVLIVNYYKMARKSKSAASPKTPAKTKKVISAPPAASPAKTKKSKAAAKSAEVPAKTETSQPQEKEFGYVSQSQASKALSELKKFLERKGENDSEKPQLFDDDDVLNDDLYVQFQTKKYYSEKPEFKPRLIELSKPFYRENDELKTCLFLRDHFITTDEKLEEVELANIPTLKKILTLTQLKTVYQTFEKRYELYSEYDLFLVDDALLSSMPLVLGKSFYLNEIDKFPISVRVSSTKSPKELSLVTLGNQVNKVLSSTAFLPPVGTEITIKIGNFSQLSDYELLANLHAVLKGFDQDLLVAVGVKTSKSPVLPLFYTDKIYGDADVLENVPEAKEEEEEEDIYTKALLELGDEQSVTKALGGELRKKKAKRSKKSKGVSKP